MLPLSAPLHHPYRFPVSLFLKHMAGSFLPLSPCTGCALCLELFPASVVLSPGRTLESTGELSKSTMSGLNNQTGNSASGPRHR